MAGLQALVLPDDETEPAGSASAVFAALTELATSVREQRAQLAEQQLLLHTLVRAVGDGGRPRSPVVKEATSVVGAGESSEWPACAGGLGAEVLAHLSLTSAARPVAASKRLSDDSADGALHAQPPSPLPGQTPRGAHRARRFNELRLSMSKAVTSALHSPALGSATRRPPRSARVGAEGERPQPPDVRHATVLTAEKIGEVLRSNKELNELLDGIERERHKLFGSSPPDTHLGAHRTSSPALPRLARKRVASLYGDEPAPPPSGLERLGRACCAPLAAAYARIVLHPDHPFRPWWDGAMIVAVMLSSMTVPLRLAFESEFGPVLLGARFLDYAIDVYFGVDICLNFALAFRTTDPATMLMTTVVDFPSIAAAYLRGWFCVDVLATLPFDLIFAASDGSSGGGGGSAAAAARLNRVLRVLRALKLFRLVRASRAVKAIEAQLTNTNPAVLRLVRIVCTLLLTWHWLGCLWYALHFFDLPPDPATGYYPLLIDADALGEARDAGGALEPRWRFVLQYSFCYFWAVTSIAGGAPVHFHPTSTAEAVYNCAVALIGVFANAAVIGSASSAFSNMDAASAKIRQRLERLKAFLQSKRTPPSVSRQVLSYAEYAWKHSRSNDEAWLLQELPSALRLQVVIALQRRLFTQIELFRLLPTTTVCTIICHMRSLIVLPGERILEQGAGGGYGLFFIIEGSVSVIVDGTGVVATLQQGDFFGERSLIDGSQTNATVEAVDYVNLMVLYRSEFDAVSRSHPEVQIVITRLKARQLAEQEAERQRKRELERERDRSSVSRRFGSHTNGPATTDDDDGRWGGLLARARSLSPTKRAGAQRGNWNTERASFAAGGTGGSDGALAHVRALSAAEPPAGARTLEPRGRAELQRPQPRPPSARRTSAGGDGGGGGAEPARTARPRGDGARPSATAALGAEAEAPAGDALCAPASAAGADVVIALRPGRCTGAACHVGTPAGEADGHASRRAAAGRVDGAGAAALGAAACADGGASARGARGA